jgi:hypothetical protein
VFKKILFFLLIFNVTNAFAIAYTTFMYQIELGDSYSLILKKFVKDDAIINAKTPLVVKTKKYNPQISDWNKLPPGEFIKLYISNDVIDFEKYNPYADSILKKLNENEEAKKSKMLPVGFKASAFYMASEGTFNQNATGVAKINFKQNSPLSLGGAFSYYPKDSLYSLSGSLYFSYLLASSNSLTSDNISIPLELGGNIYGEYRWQKYSATIYSGPDYESFSLFDLKGLQNDNKVYVNGVGVVYWSVGIAKSFSLFNKLFFSKFAVSKSILSSFKSNAPSSSNGVSDHVDSGKYSGNKFIFYLNHKINEKWYMHSMFKYHQMSGPSDVTILRIGIGVGYIFF